MSKAVVAKQKRPMPGTYVIIVGIIILMIILTYILPAGTYDFAEDGKTVIAGTYHTVERNPAGIGDFLNCFFDGMTKGASTIFLIFMIGGAFGILADTGTINACIAWIIRKTKGNYKLVLLAVGMVMALLGSVGAGNNVALAFCPIMIILCKKLKLDPIVAVAAMYMPSNSGTASSPIEPFNTILGQSIAELPQMSGAAARSIMWIIIVGLTFAYILIYCARIKKNPARSIVSVYTTADDAGDESAALESVAAKMSARHVLCMILLFAVFIVYAYGALTWSWQMKELGACMMLLAFGAGIIGKLSPNAMEKSFVNGAKTMTSSALLVGFASAISVIMTNANIIHTVIYYMSLPLQELPAFLSAVGMLIMNLIVNFFINSSSGQCYVVMPLMVPLADVIGVTRQVAVSAYAFGEALSNSIIPTASLLLGMLGIAQVPFNKWLKFCLPLSGILCVAAAVFLVVMQLLGW